MEILYLLIPISLAIVVLAIGVFFWAVKSGQYDDLEGPAWRILFDDEDAAKQDQGPAENRRETSSGGG